jgi:hypothetical protein
MGWRQLSSAPLTGLLGGVDSEHRVPALGWLFDASDPSRTQTISMVNISRHSFGQSRPSGPMMDMCGTVPIAACVYSVIVSPLAINIFSVPSYTLASMMENHPENRVCWASLRLLLCFCQVTKFFSPVCGASLVSFSAASPSH